MKLIPIRGKGNEYLFNPDGLKVIWTSRFKKGFPRLQRSLKTENTVEARDRRDELFSQWFGEKPKVSKKVKQLNADLWPIWVKTKDRKSYGTKESIKYSAAHILPMIGELYPDDVTETWWENVYIPTKRAERPDRKFFNEWKWLATYLKALHREGKIERLPRLQCPDGPRADGIYLEDSEIFALHWYGNRDLSLQIDLGFKHFMRRSEVLLLPWAEIDFDAGVINLPAERTKIREARTIPLNHKMLRRLALRRAESDSHYVFPNPMDKNRPIGRLGNASAWRGTLARANAKTVKVNPRATFHDLRHSGLTRAVRATNRYAEISKVAGVKFEELERTYLHLQTDHIRFVADLVMHKSEAK